MDGKWTKYKKQVEAIGAVCYHTFISRMNNGWDLETAMNKKSIGRYAGKEPTRIGIYKGKKMGICAAHRELCKDLGIVKGKIEFSYRIKKYGETPQQVFDRYVDKYTKAYKR